MITVAVREIQGVWYGVAYDGETILATAFASNEKEAMRSLLEAIPFNIPFGEAEKTSSFAERVLTTLSDIYNGKDAPTDFFLTVEHVPNYTGRVLKATRLIPTGYVTSYGLLAKAVGGSPRAVGNVMAMNPFAPIVPCHRVVSSDLTLGGYGGGLHVKLKILRREKRGYTAKREIMLGRNKLQVFPVEFVLKRVEKGKS
jgi:methylated-DNA-[protein]-cysteine S-methyltransferase